MDHLLVFTFVAFQPYLTGSEDNSAVLCCFSKVAKAEEVPRSSQILEVAGVKFEYDGSPEQRGGTEVVHNFRPQEFTGDARLFSRKATVARKLTPEDNDKFATVLKVLRRRGFSYVLADMNGRPLTSS